MPAVNKGMMVDIHPSVQLEGSYRYSHDGGVIVSEDKQLVWRPIQGTKQLPITYKGSEQLSHTVRRLNVVNNFENRTYWILLNEQQNKLEIHEATVVNDKLILTLLREMEASTLFGLTSNQLAQAKVLDCFGHTNGDGKRFIYLTTGVGQPLCIPIHATTVNPTVESCRYIPEAPDFSISVSEIPGGLPCGAYAFFGQLYNNDGITSLYSSPTPWVELSKTTWEDLSTVQAGEWRKRMLGCNYNGTSGGSLSDPSSRGILITPSGIPSGYKLRIACFIRGRDGASTVGDIIYEGSATAFAYTSKKSIRKVLSDDVMVQPVELHNVQNMIYNMDVQVVADFRELDGLTTNETYRARVDNGAYIEAFKPSIQPSERIVPLHVNNVQQGLGNPRLDQLREPIFAPKETYEIALLPITKSGTKGNPIVIGQVVMPDNVLNNGKPKWNKTLVYEDTNSSANNIYVPTVPINDIEITNLDVSMFSDPNIHRLEVLYRNVGNQVVGYGIARTPVKHNEDNAGGILPHNKASNEGIEVFSSNLIIHLPEHLFGFTMADELKDCKVELLTCYDYACMYGMKDFLLFCDEKNYIGGSTLNFPPTLLSGMGSHVIRSVMELSYDNTNSIVMEGIKGRRRNSTAIDGDNSWGYGAKSLLVKLATSYPFTSRGFFGWCRIVKPSTHTSNSSSFRSSGVTIDMGECFWNEYSGRLLAPIVKLQRGDTYVRTFSTRTVIPNDVEEFKSIFEDVRIPCYSKLDLAMRVGNHLGTTFNRDTFEASISAMESETQNKEIHVDYSTGSVLMEDYSLHDHYKEAKVDQFTWQNIQEQLRTRMYQHIRWNVKRTINSRYDELRKFLPSDIAGKNLSAGRIMGLYFNGSNLIVIQESAIGKYPYNEKVPISSKVELVLGTGKEFSSYYTLLNDGISDRRYSCKFGKDVAVYLESYNGLVTINSDTNPTVELPSIDIPKLLKVSSLVTSKGYLSSSPSVNGLTYLSVGNVSLLINDSNFCSGYTDSIPEHASYISNIPIAATNDGTLKAYSMVGTYAYMFDRPLSPFVELVCAEFPLVVKPHSMMVHGLACPITQINVDSEQHHAVGGYLLFDAMERRNFRKINAGWLMRLPMYKANGRTGKVFGNYVIVKLSFPSDSNYLSNFGSITGYEYSKTNNV